MRRYIAEREAQLVFDLTATHAANPLDPGDKFANLLGIIRSEFFLELAAMTALWKSFRDTDEHLAAVDIVKPMLEEIAALEAQLEAENTERGAKLAALAKAEETALERAQAAALADPAVITARRALEAMDASLPTKKAKAETGVS